MFSIIFILNIIDMCVWMKLDLKLLFLLKTCNRIGAMVLERVDESYCLLKLSNTMNMTVCFVYFFKQAAVILWFNIFDIFDNNCLANVYTVNSKPTFIHMLEFFTRFAKATSLRILLTTNQSSHLWLFSKLYSTPWSQILFAAKQ